MMTRPIAAPSAFAGHSSAARAPAHEHAPAVETPLPNLGAVAHATGPSIHFASPAGLELMGHEAAHVVQQRGGAASPHAGMYEP